MIESMIKKRFPGITYVSHSYNKGILYLHLKSTAKMVFCPYCCKPAFRIHSYHIRKFFDVPYNGNGVVVFLRIRKFFCENHDCGHVVFSETYEFINPDEKRSNRLIRRIISAYEGRSAGEVVLSLRKTGINVCKATVCNLKNKYS